MKWIQLIVFLWTAYLTMGQTIADFEQYMLEEGEYINNSSPEAGFSSGKVFLPNYYYPEFDSWAGWAISADTDTTTPGFNNQYSAITGSGYDGSTHFALSSPGAQFGGTVLRLTGAHAGGVVEGMYVTNNTYAYLSMLNGDAFAKKFGGETGDDPDFFRLTVKKYLEGTLQPDSIDFYLADYRFEDQSNDYIVNEWTWLDLSSLGKADSLYFTLRSSDVGPFGMNTPAYFCIDQVVTKEMPTAVASPGGSYPAAVVYPNPADQGVSLSFEGSGIWYWRMVDLNGRTLRSGLLRDKEPDIRIHDLKPGLYCIIFRNEEITFTRKLIVR